MEHRPEKSRKTRCCGVRPNPSSAINSWLNLHPPHPARHCPPSFHSHLTCPFTFPRPTPTSDTADLNAGVATSRLVAGTCSLALWVSVAPVTQGYGSTPTQDWLFRASRDTVKRPAHSWEQMALEGAVSLPCHPPQDRRASLLCGIPDPLSWPFPPGGRPPAPPLLLTEPARSQDGR